MGNSHGVADFAYELQTTTGDLLPACVVSTTPPAVPGSGLTLAAFATRAYVRAGQQLTYVDQPAVTVSITGGDGQYWLAVTDDTFSAFAGWTRRAGSHYMWRASATRPADLDNLLVINQLTVSGGNITAVSTPWGVAPPLALATADKVSLGGHASTGVLDVQGSVVASDSPNAYFGVRVWPVAPSGAATIQGVRIEPLSGTPGAGTTYLGMAVNELPAGLAAAYGYHTLISAGTNRWNVFAAGTAQNYFAGNVGIGNSTPSYPLDVSATDGVRMIAPVGLGVDPVSGIQLKVSGFPTHFVGQVGIGMVPTYPLDVTGNVRVTGSLGVGTTPGGNGMALRYIRASQNGILITPDADSGAAALYFQNASLGGVGSITTTASATAFNTSSDVRLKHAVQALLGGLAVIQALKPVSFKWNADDSPGIGFLAHELMRHVPEAVTGEPDAVNDDGSVRPQGVDHSKLVPWLTACCQELAQQVQALTARVAQLEGA